MKFYEKTFQIGEVLPGDMDLIKRAQELSLRRCGWHPGIPIRYFTDTWYNDVTVLVAEADIPVWRTLAAQVRRRAWIAAVRLGWFGLARRVRIA